MSSENPKVCGSTSGIGTHKVAADAFKSIVGVDRRNSSEDCLNVICRTHDLQRSTKGSDPSMETLGETRGMTLSLSWSVRSVQIVRVIT